MNMTCTDGLLDYWPHNKKYEFVYWTNSGVRTLDNGDTLNVYLDWSGWNGTPD